MKIHDPAYRTKLKTDAIGTVRERIAQTVVSNDPSLDFSLVGYDAYEVVFDRLLPATDDTYIQLQVSVDGGSTFFSGATDYASVIVGLNTGGEIEDGIDSTAMALVSADATEGISNTSAELGYNGTIRCYQAAGYQFHVNGTGTYASSGDATIITRNSQFGRCVATTSIVDAIRISMSSGNLSTGTISVYGIK
jgi:hypothetical protein